ncbi:pathogenesis-related thaumatin-like protein 3.5 [Nicotiana tabacum]|uniref:Pathogenesis-related protein 5-like isoform X1 n=1 Tax=Nicotiana tabacum TaxID=4097 RepID=A0A1S4DFE2_TOBAC|nr:PREDICTED: pathogenesis-related protein 5-like isoform X1 [Nicotiana tabacum]
MLMASHFTSSSQVWFLFLAIALGVKLSECANITIINYCKETVWPGITPKNNFSGDGFELKQGQSAVFTAPTGWSGRIWGRTGCDFDKNNNGTCQTGRCGTGLKCNEPGQPPASIAEFTLGETDFYDVSLVDGFNLPIVVKPVNGKGNCSSAGCDSDLRPNCPSELALKLNNKTIACRSACNVFDTDEYCCRGAYSSPVSCLPTNYSRIFKTACPVAYSFAFDDPTSVITCSSTDYVVSFCSSRVKLRTIDLCGKSPGLAHSGNLLHRTILFGVKSACAHLDYFTSTKFG